MLVKSDMEDLHVRINSALGDLEVYALQDRAPDTKTQQAALALLDYSLEQLDAVARFLETLSGLIKD